MKSLKFLLIILSSCIFIVGCSKKNNEVEPVRLDNAKKYSVWTTYWQTENVFSELNNRKDSIENISYFGAYFNENGTLFIPEKINDIFSQVQETYEHKKFGSYLTIVNDVLRQDGSSILKDTELLYKLFSVEDSINVHVKEIISLVEENGYRGIEIDYENIKKDVKLWELFISFIDKMYTETAKKKIPLRIVLEPSAPVERVTFPDGPEYVVMCYNLHGNGTKPGPKADIEFLNSVIQKMSVLPGKISFALATGGFDFQENGKVTSITEIEAIALKNTYNSILVRHEESGSMTFYYTDENGLSHDVWYADAKTIKLWSDIIEKAGGYGVSLWKI